MPTGTRRRKQRLHMRRATAARLRARRRSRNRHPHLGFETTGAPAESADIVAYVYRRYGAGGPPILMTLPVVTQITVSLASMLYGGGFSARAARAAEQPLELIGTEASPGTRMARSRLSRSSSRT